jgi:hypothetical protein
MRFHIGGMHKKYRLELSKLPKRLHFEKTVEVIF